MSAPDLQHPGWCDHTLCTASQGVAGEHLSAPVRIADPLGAQGAMVEQHVIVQLAKRSCEPVTSGQVYLVLRFERGPVESTETYRLELETAAELAGLVTAFCRRVWSGP